MLTRRVFANCAICTAMGLIASGEAHAQGVQRTVLRQMDGPVEGWTTILIRGEIAPDAVVATHTHPGIESAFIIEGGGVLVAKDTPAQALKAGESFQIAPGVPHGLQNGPAVMRFTSTYVVEKSKPLASPATL